MWGIGARVRQLWTLLALMVLALVVGAVYQSPGLRAAEATDAVAASSPLRVGERARVAPDVTSQQGPIDADTITFDEFPVGTSITTQYEGYGVHFGGDSPFITQDDANPSWPVLSGSPEFEGVIELRVVDPSTGNRTTTQGIRLDVGFIDNRNSVEVAYFDLSDRPLGAVRANSFGINTLTIPLAGIHRVTVAAVEDEPAGFAIDNVRIGVSTVTTRPQRMLMLGDSYSSGEGLVRTDPQDDNLSYDCGTNLLRNGYFENTNLPSYLLVPSTIHCDTTTGQPLPLGFNHLSRPERMYENRCHRHGQAWPNQVRESLGVSGQNGLFIACSGARTPHIGALREGNEAKHAEPGSPNGVAGGQTQMRNALDFVAARGPADLVTVGIGGNDAAFEPIIRQCILHRCLEEDDWASSSITRINQSVYPDLVETFQTVREEFSPAAILAYGYPSVIHEDLICRDLRLTRFGGIDENEARWARTEFLPALNQAIEDAAAEAGVTFMPTLEATRGHEVCAEEAWINGFRWVGRKESFHPQPRAHRAIAAYFVEHYTDGDGGLLFANPDPRPAIRSPLSSLTVVTGGGTVTPEAPCGAECLQPACTADECGLHMDVHGFSPQTTLQVQAVPLEGFAEAQGLSAATEHGPAGVALGEVQTDEAGAVTASLDLPDSVEDGFYLVDVSGVSPDGVRQVGDFPLLVRRVPLTCRDELPPSPFGDRASIPDVHVLRVDCAHDLGIVQGFADGMYGPALSVRRDQMASFIVRALEASGYEFPEADGAPFTDVDATSPHAESIRMLAAAGVVQGGPSGRPASSYGPALPVRRDQMATFLVRAAELVTDGPWTRTTPEFDDVGSGNVHVDSVNGVFATGLARGFADGTFRPASTVRRDQMSSFLIGLFERLGEAATEGAWALPS